MWQIIIHNSNGSVRHTLTPEDPVHSFEWHSRGHGDCLEATITGRGLDIRARDIVAILARDHADDPNPPTLRYIGWVVEVPARRSPDLSTTRLIGGRKRLEELLTRQFRINSGDAANMAATASVGAHLDAPEGQLPLRRLQAPAWGGAFAPVQGFTAGERLPLFETIAETLDALKLMVPGFTVLPSSSYTYDGRTYTPGQDVPPTEWGVLANTEGGTHRAQIYFRRPTHVPQALNENTDQLSIAWRPRSAEQLVDDITVVLLAQHNADAATISSDPLFTGYVNRTMPPVIHRYLHNNAAYGSAISINAEGQGWKESGWTGSHVSAGWTNPGNAFDGNSATYARNDAVWPYTLARSANPATVFWRIRYSSFIPVKVDLYRNVPVGGIETHHIWNLPSTNGIQVDKYLQAPPFAGTYVPAYLAISSDMHNPEADEMRIYEVTPYEPDSDALDQIAAGHVILPGTADAATVTVPNRLLPIAWRWQIALADGGTYTGTAELIHHRITSDQGAVTTLHLEQGLASTESAVRALLDTRIRQAVSAGTRLTK